jgi:hypothetical protein
MPNPTQATPSTARSNQKRATLRWVMWVVGGCVGGVALLLFGIGVLLPNRWNVTRDVLIHAPAAEIHQLVDDWRAWESWARDPGDDPTLRYSYSGNPQGVGATRSFVGQYAGAGRSEIVKSDPTTGTAFVSAVRSDTNNAHGSITYRPQGGSTLVTWNDQGTIESLFGVFLRANVEDELTKHMDRSLQRLKAVAEERASQRDAATE